MDNLSLSLLEHEITSGLLAVAVSLEMAQIAVIEKNEAYKRRQKNRNIDTHATYRIAKLAAKKAFGRAERASTSNLQDNLNMNNANCTLYCYTYRLARAAATADVSHLRHQIQSWQVICNGL